MGEKKDPGKFTIRFNIADPQQQAVAEMLNRQGRYKAQFITNAVMLYIHAASKDSTAIQYVTADTPASFKRDKSTEEFESNEKAGGEQAVDWGSGLGDTDIDSIRKTMEAFHSK